MRTAIFQSNTEGLTPGQRLARLHDVALDAGSDLLLCPELFMSGYTIGPDMPAHAEPADGAFATAVSDIAHATNTNIVYGYPELSAGVLYNSAQCIDAAGRRVANHRKLVLPPGFEADCFTAGDKLTLFELSGMPFALLICYDIEFPEAARACVRAGAEVLLAPTALSAQWGVVAYNLIPTRAFENGAFVLYANHAGRERDTRYLGASCIVGPDGKDLARAGDTDTLISARLEPTRIAAARARLPYLNDLADLHRRLV